MKTYELPAEGTYFKITKDYNAALPAGTVLKATNSSTAQVDGYQDSYSTFSLVLLAGPLVEVVPPVPEFKPGQVWEDASGMRYFVADNPYRSGLFFQSASSHDGGALEVIWSTRGPLKLVLDVS